jgi:hypothetical protein
MTQEITQEMIRTLSDIQLALVHGWTGDEQKTRVQTREQETIAKIKELARSIERTVKIEGVRGRPPKSKDTGALVRAAK